MDIRTTHLKWNALKNPELLNEASPVQIILSWISFSLKVVSAKMSLLLMLLRQEEDTICAGSCLQRILTEIILMKMTIIAAVM